MAETSVFEEKLLSLGLKNHYTSAVVEVTKRCNAHCDFCYLHDRSVPDLPTDKMYKIIDKIAQENIMHLTLTGGEPFVRSDILELLDHIRQKDFWHTAIFTNGTLLRNEHIEYLVNHSSYFPIVQMSAFSHIPEIHDEYVGIPGALVSIIENGKRLQDGGIHVRMTVNLLDINSASFNRTFEYFHAMGFDVKIGRHKLICRSQEQHNQNRERLDKCTSVDFFTSVVQQEVPQVFQKEPDSIDNEDFVTNPDKVLLCKGLHTTIAIDADGNVRPCVSFRNVVLGNIFECATLRELLGRSEFIERLKKMRLSDMVPCKTCRHNNACTICLGMVHTEHNCLNRPTDQLCNYYSAIDAVEKAARDEHAA